MGNIGDNVQGNVEGDAEVALRPVNDLHQMRSADEVLDAVEQRRL